MRAGQARWCDETAHLAVNENTLLGFDRLVCKQRVHHRRKVNANTRMRTNEINALPKPTGNFGCRDIRQRNVQVGQVQWEVIQNRR